MHAFRRASASLSLVLGLLATASAGASVGAGSTDTWLASVTASIAADEYDLSPHGGGGCTAPNRAQGLRATWRDGVLVVTPRVDGAAWTFRYELAGVSRGGAAPEGLAVTREDVDGGRIEWGRGDNLREWYLNDARGIEQGFTLDRRPDGEAGAPVAIDGWIDGLLAYPSADGRSVLLRGPAGIDAMRIGQLVVRDARGVALPACLDVAPGMLSILLDDRDAMYPIHIDPLMTSPAWTADSDQLDANLGFSVATAGDVNGDGFSDVIVGAPGYDGGQITEGRAFVYHGSSSGLATLAAWTAESDQASASLGFSVATAGDVDGDGFSDVIVGARLFSNGQAGEGAAFVYHGSAVGLAPLPGWTAEGNQVSAFFGYSVATAGDVDDDGYSDVIVGAPAYDNGQSGEGRAFVFRGAATGLAPAASWTAESNQAGAFFGFSVATAGDVNGDGFSDVIVGADAYDGGQSGEGRAFVYHGAAGGLAAAAAWTAEGDQVDAQFGWSVATAGDVDGDGFSDVVVGARRFDNGQSNEGRAFVYLGAAAGLARAPAWTAEGDQAHAQFGTSVATAGDVDGDGFADVIVGASLFDGGQVDEGRASVYLGGATGLAAAAMWTIESDQAGAQLGTAVGTAGDVNGDGWSDVIVGTPFLDAGDADEGRASVYGGSATGLATAAGWMAEGGQVDALLGCSVATAGDVNGDGYSDVIVGAKAFDGGESLEGAAFAYFGSADGLATSPGWTAEGNQPDAQFGFSVATAGDVNGDGYSDIVVGAPNFTAGETFEGRAFVYHGSAAGPSMAAAWTGEGDSALASFGSSVATAGDVNGDAFSDVIVGAFQFTNGQNDEGRAFVFLGTAAGLEATPAWTAESDQAQAWFGSSVASAGDVNGDGYSDVIVGSPMFDDGQPEEGRAFVHLGSRSGLSALPAWQVGGDQDAAQFGGSVATAGDVNGDGYSDVIVGARAYDNGEVNEGRAFVYLGSPSGPGLTAVWTAEGNQFAAVFGSSVATAGDVNGDGYSDVVVGARHYENGQPEEGRALVYQGSATGLGASPTWTAESDQRGAHFGASVGMAGDVNGDGYSDVIVGADGYDAGQPYEGAAFLYYGNDGDGLDRIPRQRRFDDSAPIDIVGLGDETNGFRIHARARSPYGRDRVRLEAEVKPLGTPFDGSGTLTTPFTDTGLPGPDGSFVDLDVASGPLAIGPHHWRVRLRGTFPFPWQSHWMSPPYNCATETDLRVAAPRCDEPSPIDLRPAAPPLLVTKAGTDTVSLIWESTGAPRYHVYGGDIADLAPARPAPDQVLCGIPTNATNAPAIGPGRWFVAVASCPAMESSYGRDSFARDRDPAAVPCP